jgi:hypothetical protein
LSLSAPSNDPTPVPAITLNSQEEQQQEQQKLGKDYAALLIRIYQKHNPAKLEVSGFIAKTLQRYEGREEALVTALQEKYGLTFEEICVRQQPLTAAAAAAVTGGPSQYLRPHQDQIEWQQSATQPGLCGNFSNDGIDGEVEEEKERPKKQQKC